MKISRDQKVLFVFLTLALAVRLVSFFSSVLDHDESTYLIIGRDLLNGKYLYNDVTDSKPVGIFAIYAFLHFLFGHSIAMTRVFVALLVGITSYLLYLVSNRLLKNSRVAVATGLIYIYCTSTWNYFGLSPNTELFFNFFTACSLVVLLRKSVSRYCLAGLFFGLGFIIKYLVLFDFLALMSFLLIYEIKLKKGRFCFGDFSPFLAAGLGFALPFLFVNFLFFIGDHFEHFKFITYDLPGRYMDNGTLWQFVKLILDFSGRFLPVTFLVFYVLFSKQKILTDGFKYLLIYWVLAILLAIYLPGRGFSHYAIQLMIPVSFIAGVAFHSHFQLDRYTRIFYRGKSGIAFGLLLVFVIQIVGISGKINRHDEPEVVAEYLDSRLNEKDEIFVANYEQIVYYLLQKESPTKFVHSSILTSPHLSNAFNVNPEKELTQILRKQPKYILIKNRFQLLEHMMRGEYVLEKSFFKGKVLAYRRII